MRLIQQLSPVNPGGQSRLQLHADGPEKSLCMLAHLTTAHSYKNVYT